MKMKTEFVTNSSSTSFIIRNTSDSVKDLVNFVEENSYLLYDFLDDYSYVDHDRFSEENLIDSARRNNMYFEPGKDVEAIFGDEDGTIIGQVFDYMLREGGNSKSFTWWYNESLR